MTRERRAVAAFLVLAASATGFAVALHPRPASEARPRPAAVRIVTCCEPAPRSALARALARTMATSAEAAETVASRSQSAVASVCDTVPVYPLAVRVSTRRDVALLRAVNRVPGVPVVSRMERFSLGKHDWLGDRRVLDAFGYYGLRMRPMGFAGMPESTRQEIGVRATGSVDSPPLLYANATGAALLQGLPNGVVRLTLFCGAVEL